MLDRRDTLTGLIDNISGYFLDHCPEGMYWEDYDPDLDGMRSLLQGFYETENRLRGASDLK